MGPLSPTAEYFFDLHGYTVLHNALGEDHVEALNRWVNDLPPLNAGQWLGRINVHAYGDIDGVNLQNILEGGELFERLIDHPSWIDLVCYLTGDRHHPFIHEAFLNIRGPAGYIGVHSGGHIVDSRKRGGRDRGQWCCSYLSILIALTDVGPGDGATVVVPGSHKSDFPNPMQNIDAGISVGPGEEVLGAEEVHVKAGDALLINDYICHGSSERTKPGERRMVIFRYMPNIYAPRFGYQPSPEFLSRLTPRRQDLVQPIKPLAPPAAN